MPADKIDPAFGPYSPWTDINSEPVATVRLGETTMAQVAARLNMDVDALLEANPQITNPAKLMVGQDIRLPVCQLPGTSRDAVTTPSPASGPPAAHATAARREEPAADEEEWCFTPGCGDFAPLQFTKEQVVPRAVGALKVGAGAAGFVAGAALCETGIGCAVGGPLMVFSADVAGSGAGQIISGKPEPTVVGAIGGERLQAIEEEIVNAAALAVPAAEGVAMWRTGKPVINRPAPSPRPVTAGSVAAPALNAAEQSIVQEVRAILKAPEMQELRQAYAAGKDVTVRIGGRVIQYEPGLKASGMTMFGENGFLLGREAFQSEAELVKTLLHETHRLTTSAAAEGVSGALVKAETDAAYEFAERAYQAVMTGK
jgi:hypothetical protein